MSEQLGYIHISEAVRKYKKTRQTFYNYIRKGLIETKKKQNKIFLRQADIEQLESNYFLETTTDNNQVIITTPSSSSSIVSKKVFPNRELEKSLLLLHSQYKTLQDSLMHEVKATRQELLLDNKTSRYNHEQRLLQEIQQQYRDTNNFKKQISNRLKGLTLGNRKAQFWIGYCSIVTLHILLSLVVL